jgi:hypothetical protein
LEEPNLLTPSKQDIKRLTSQAKKGFTAN